MRAYKVTQVGKEPQADDLGRLARLAADLHQVVVDDRDATIAQLQAQTLKLIWTTLDAVALGVCRFDGEGRLVLSNRRYAAIYRLAPVPSSAISSTCNPNASAREERPRSFLGRTRLPSHRGAFRKVPAYV